MTQRTVALFCPMERILLSLNMGLFSVYACGSYKMYDPEHIVNSMHKILNVLILKNIVPVQYKIIFCKCDTLSVAFF